MLASDFDFELPPDRIAQHPLPDPLDARLMVLERATDRLIHARVRDLPQWVRPDDVWVGNDTRVIPARVRARKEASGGKVEVFFLRDLGGGEWEALLRAGSRRPQPGEALRFGRADEARAVFLEAGDLGRCRLRVESPRPLLDLLEEVGETPLPPYIKRDPEDLTARQRDRERYQTVFARTPGAVAAPTAGLHFTPELLAALRERGAEFATVTLHVGLGTFRPITAERIEDHRMDAERYEVPADTAERLRAARARGGRIVAVGSTSTRTLETMAARHADFAADAGESTLFIRPPYPFRAVDALFTNFHLPRSTLLLMMSAFAGRERILSAYAEAVREGYRFFSYGDAMLIV
jgi:S-adenosylmethionine:tRNA ribosyltransferase-isomerase